MSTTSSSIPPGRLANRRASQGGGPARPSWLLTLPAIAALLLIHLIPTIAGGYHAFTDWNGVGRGTWTGFDNFEEIFDDPAARGALWNTLKLTLGFIVIGNLLGLGLALGLNRTLKSRHFLRALIFAPVVVSPVAMGFLWQYIFQTDGALNTILGSIGLESLERPWLGDPTTALWSILVVMLWQLTGLLMVIYLAGLASIPDEFYEAAAVDGAGMVRQLRAITLPFLAPAVTINLTLSSLIGLRVFDQVVALTNGGPANTTQTLATEIYIQAFTLGRFGYSTAIAVLLTLLVLLFTVVQALLTRRKQVA